jgi:hypothetical protein
MGKNYTLWPSGIYHTYANLSQHLKVNPCNLLHQQDNEQNHMIVSKDVEKEPVNIQRPFIIKILSKLGETNSLNLKRLSTKTYS